MKKASLALGVCMALSACSKNYTCECTTNNGATVLSTSDIRAHKKEAKRLCARGNKTIGYATIDCAIQ